jgi:hypothetical protein
VSGSNNRPTTDNVKCCNLKEIEEGRRKKETLTRTNNGMEKVYGISEARKCACEKKEEMDEGRGYEHTVKLVKLATLLILPPVTVGYHLWNR